MNNDSRDILVAGVALVVAIGGLIAVDNWHQRWMDKRVHENYMARLEELITNAKAGKVQIFSLVPAKSHTLKETVSFHAMGMRIAAILALSSVSAVERFKEAWDARITSLINEDYDEVAAA